jgi:LysM repeat protein
MNNFTSKIVVQSGDSFSKIANKNYISLFAFQFVNPGVLPQDLQIGQELNIVYTVVAGDSLDAICAALHCTSADMEFANPGISLNPLQAGQILQLPPPTEPPLPPRDQTYIQYSGPSSSFPDPSNWLTFERLWEINSNLMGSSVVTHDGQQFRNTPAQIEAIATSIQQVSASSGVDARVILCVVMQESGGNVHVGDTLSPDQIVNTGIMQAHAGVRFDSSNETGSILRMVRDGTEGTQGDGLKQCLEQSGGDYYTALRRYNSGSVDARDLQRAFGATPLYVSDIANRLVGNTWSNM